MCALYSYGVSDKSAFMTSNETFHFVMHCVTDTALKKERLLFNVKATSDAIICLIPDHQPPWNNTGYLIFIGTQYNGVDLSMVVRLPDGTGTTQSPHRYA